MTDKNPAYNLIICGGQSLRMGFDKSLLNYHGDAQRYYLYDLLLPVSQKVFISCNERQAHEMEPGYDFLIDEEIYAGSGPAAALLTAHHAYGNVSFVATGCDYPFLTLRDIDLLMQTGMQKNRTVAYFNEEKDFYEPLIAFYHYSDLPVLKINFSKGEYSLNRFLKEINAARLIPEDIRNLRSVDTYAAFIDARNEIEGTNFYM